MVEKRVTIQLRVSPAAYERVKKRAKDNDRTIAEQLREMLKYADEKMAR